MQTVFTQFLIKTTIFIQIFAQILFLLIFQPLLSSEPEWTNPINLQEINSSKDDFAPHWNQYERKLYFASDRKGKSKFFVTEFDQSLKFSIPKELPDPLNKTTRNVSYLRFINETEAILNAFRRGKVQSYINIFYSQRIANQWQKPIPLDSLQCECFVLHPTISPDGNFIIFSSDLNSPSHLDLYIAYKKENGIWGNVEKIEELSTDGDEITPFLASNDTLYFASNGFGGPGGFDLFYSVRKENYWDKPIPLNQINSRFDESDFAVINDTLAIFASNRPEGLGGLDLYLTRRTVQKEFASELETKLDLSLSVQISIVRVQQELAYELALFPQVAHNSFLQQSIIDTNLNPNLLPNLDLLPQNFLSILLKRIVNLNSKVYLFYDTSNSEVHSLVLAAIEKFEMLNTKLKELIEIEHSKTDYLLVRSDNPNLFEPIRIGKLTEIFEPPVLELTINARPEKLISSFEFMIRNTNIKRKGTKVPHFASIELNPDSLFLIRNSDTLFVDLVAEDTLGRKHFISYPIILNKSSVSYRNSIIFKGKRYDRIYLPSNLKVFENRLDFAKLGEEFPQFSDNTSNYTLVGRIEMNPQELASKIALLLSIPSNRITFVTNPTEYESVYGKIPPGFIILLVERK